VNEYLLLSHLDQANDQWRNGNWRNGNMHVIGEMGIGEMGIGEMGIGEMGGHHCNLLSILCILSTGL